MEGSTLFDETDISQERQWLYEQRARVAVGNLQKRSINAQYVPSRQEALSAILDMIAPGATVARADSVTLDQVGVIPELRKSNRNKVIYSVERDAEGYWLAEPEQKWKMERETFSSDVFLTGTNAITLDGKLVNIDGHGNRVSTMIFGPRKVIVVAGANKIVKDITEALERIQNICAPMNAKRHYLKHHHSAFGELPCVRTGKCADCKHEWRICCYTVVIEGSMGPDRGRINVVLVGEELGI